MLPDALKPQMRRGCVRQAFFINTGIHPSVLTVLNLWRQPISLNMVPFAAVALLLFAVPSTATGAARGLFGGEKVACSKLKARYPESTFLPGTLGYAYETQERMRSQSTANRQPPYLLTISSLLVSHSVQQPCMRLRSSGCPASCLCGYYHDPDTLTICCARRRAYANTWLQRNR
jgi:hypothetical protein